MLNTHLRSLDPEILDQHSSSYGELYENMREISHVNRFLGGYKGTLRGIRLLEEMGEIKVIADIGCGGGDTLVKLAGYFRKKRKKVLLKGIEINPEIASIARLTCAAFPEIEIIHCSYQKYLAHNKVDVIHASHFLHHLNPAEVKEFLTLAKNKALIGVLINDLKRSAMAYYSVKALSRIFFTGRLFRNDAPLSVLKGFRKNEIVQDLQELDIRIYELDFYFPYRFILTIPC